MYFTKPSKKARNKSGSGKVETKFGGGKKKRLQSAHGAKKKKSPGKFLEHQT